MNYLSPEDAQTDYPGHYVHILEYKTLDNGRNVVVEFELLPLTEMVYGGRHFQYEESA